MNKPDHTAAAEKRFSDSDAALKWNEMYASETERLDEANFRNRRDTTVDYVMKVLPPGGKVLDIGCGAAPVVSELRRRGVECVGVEYAGDMIKHARNRLRSMGLDDDKLYRADCRAVPFEDASFDVIVCLGVISYVEDFERAIGEIHRLLKPGGHALVSFRNLHSLAIFDPIKAIKKAVKMLIPGSRKTQYTIGRYMDHREVTKAFADYDFEYRDFFGIGFGPIKFNGRRMFSERSSIRISDAIASILAKLRWRAAVRWASDVSLWVYSTKPQTGKGS